MRRIFVNDELEKSISDQGYAVVRDFASQYACDDLSDFFERTDSTDTRPFTITNWGTDNEYRHKTYIKIAGDLSELASSYLQNYKPVMSVFASKRPGAQSE